jgi:16S rRNA (uracil1498-N3)-methyltransferase
MRRFFVAATHLSESHAVVSGPEFHHLRRVLRLTIGDHVTLRDDLNREYSGVIMSLSSSEARIAITASKELSSERCPLLLAQGLLKGQKMDLVIEKATELGVHCIAPFASAFTVAHLPQERQAERMARWMKIAQSAAKQSGNSVPRIDPPQAFATLLSALPPEAERILFYEKEERCTLKYFAQERPHLAALSIIIGPEGGFSPAEIALARDAGVHVVGLGARTLRAETAALVAISLCQFLWNS